MTHLSCFPTVRRFRRVLAGGLAAAASSLLIGACGNQDDTTQKTLTPVELCNDIAAIECAQIYRCTSYDQRAALGLTVNQDACTAGLRLNIRCSSATATGVCDGMDTMADAQECHTQALNATCQQIVANTTNVAAYAPKCVPCLKL